MANTIAIDQSHRTTPKHSHIGLVMLSVVSTEVYATATGGITVDLTTPLAALGINYLDVVDISGTPTLTGHMPAITKHTVAGQFKVRLWNGTAEIAEGAVTQTMILRVWFNQSSPS